MIATIARRIVEKVAVRGAFLAIGVGADVSPFVDLRGQLPVDGQYPLRNMERVDTQIIHHSATTGSSIHSIAQFHIEARGWPAIAYHFAIGWDGKCYQLNDVDRRTNHAAGWNSRSIGVVLIGNYEERPVPAEVVKACERLTAYIAETYGAHTILFHRDTKITVCPGKFATEALQGLKQVDV